MQRVRPNEGLPFPSSTSAIRPRPSPDVAIQNSLVHAAIVQQTPGGRGVLVVRAQIRGAPNSDPVYRDPGRLKNPGAYVHLRITSP